MTLFFLYCRDRPKNTEEDKGNVESIYARVTNMHQNTWQNLRLIWIDYEQLIMDWFHCTSKSTDNLAQFDASVLTSFMISLFLAASAPRVQRAWNLTETSVPDSLESFCLWKTTILNRINILFGYVLQTSGAIELTLLYVKLWC